MDNDNNSQEELGLSGNASSSPDPISPIQKQVQELKAKLASHTEEAGMDMADLQENTIHMRKLHVGTLLALLLLGLSVCIFLHVQTSVVRAQLDSMQPTIAKGMDQFNTRLEPLIKEFATELQQFAMAHPDFQPILNHYRQQLPEYFPSIVPALPPASPGPNP